jgi:hypothetical protein
VVAHDCFVVAGDKGATSASSSHSSDAAMASDAVRAMPLSKEMSSSTRSSRSSSVKADESPLPATFTGSPGSTSTA